MKDGTMAVHESEGIDYVADWLYLISDLVPPFCVEIVLKNGQQFYLHSIASKDTDTKSMVIRIWDMRALTDNDIEQLKKNLNQTNSREDLANEKEIHPSLAWANLRINLSEIAYCVEWHDRMWPENKRPKIGYDIKS